MEMKHTYTSSLLRNEIEDVFLERIGLFLCEVS